jgi:hypothetical protein
MYNAVWYPKPLVLKYNVQGKQEAQANETLWSNVDKNGNTELWAQNIRWEVRCV